MSAMDKVLAVILGGGRGTRLQPLTLMRSKPAVPIAGKYRLIDIPISNCINSGIYKIAVLTQFNSVSLHRHITRTYQFDNFHVGWVQIWAAEQTTYTADWYQGTADAVRKQLFEIRSARTPFVLILAGDHLYRMDYEAMARFHWEHDADITVAVQPVLASEADRFGILKRKPDYTISDFAEKPKDPETLARMISRDDPARPYLGSMGVYIFKTNVLFELLAETKSDDFGNHVIPKAIGHKRVFGYDFEGFWEDIGTIRSFYDTNLLLTGPDSPFNFFDQTRPIYSHSRFLPGSHVDNSLLNNVLMTDGCLIQSAEISRSVIGLRSQIKPGVKIINTIMMGSDYYDREYQSQTGYDDGTNTNYGMPLGIGEHSSISGAILDKNVRIGKRVIIKPFERGQDFENDLCYVRDGIVVIPKNTVLPDGTQIGPD
ncbi:MAG: glucose-1-phosphate adenylyltransferase [Chloroflexi bacterium 44-23]|nr:MAG: glucose-1-phosphate adenylyltransferase [Chloroflexi bacterium 44-23]